jgi:alkylated DNA repair protein (DNA oxidative demethylase)
MREIYPGAIHLPGFLSLDEQVALVDRCRTIASAPAGLYRPTVRGGGRMHVEMCCLGLHWNANTYRYERLRSDHDHLPVQPLPEDLKSLAQRAAAATNMTIEPDICLLVFYGETSAMGLHRDRDERPQTIAAGVPIVSVSLGDSARFRVGGLSRKERLTTVMLESGDIFVMGGPSRLRYHGVPGILPGTAPAELRLRGRFNLTFRQY